MSPQRQRERERKKKQRQRQREIERGKAAKEETAKKDRPLYCTLLESTQGTLFLAKEKKNDNRPINQSINLQPINETCKRCQRLVRRRRRTKKKKKKKKKKKVTNNVHEREKKNQTK